MISDWYSKEKCGYLTLFSSLIDDFFFPSIGWKEMKDGDKLTNKAYLVEGTWETLNTLQPGRTDRATFTFEKMLIVAFLLKVGCCESPVHFLLDTFYVYIKSRGSLSYKRNKLYLTSHNGNIQTLYNRLCHRLQKRLFFGVIGHMKKCGRLKCEWIGSRH